MVGIVEEVGSRVTKVKPGDRVTVNVEIFCGKCFFCQNGYVNNCTDKNGGWALGCQDFRNQPGGYSSDHWRRSHRDLYPFVRDAETSKKDHFMRG